MKDSENGQIIILAGGMSSRMKKSAAAEENTEFAEKAFNLPKAMLPIGPNGVPFLNLLLKNISLAGYHDAVIVVNEQDKTIQQYYETNFSGVFENVTITYAIQTIPPGRSKPLGTSDAVEQALNSRPDWRGKLVTVCNGDNLYSVNALRIIREESNTNAMADYDRSALRFPLEKVLKFAVTLKNSEGHLLDVIEKPDETAAKRAEVNGRLGVSMNLWRFSYDEILPFLSDTPINKIRNEKELPTTVKLMINSGNRFVKCIPINEHIPDLTDVEDFKKLNKNLL